MSSRDYGTVRSTSGLLHILRDEPDGNGVMLGYWSDQAFVVVIRLSRLEASRLRAALGRAVGEDEEG